MIDLIELVWPRLQGERTPEEKKASRSADYAIVDVASWGVQTEIALEEARRLQDAEMDRRKTAEGKAATYLSLVGVLIPLLASWSAAAWNDEVALGQRVSGVVLLLLTVAYLLAAGHWAFQALSIQAAARVDALDLARVWAGSRKPSVALIRKILRCVRHDRDIVNRKMSAILMTQAFLRQAAVTITALVLVQVMWKPAEAVVAHIGGIVERVQSPTATPSCETPAAPRAGSPAGGAS